MGEGYLEERISTGGSSVADVARRLSGDNIYCCVCAFPSVSCSGKHARRMSGLAGAGAGAGAANCWKFREGKDHVYSQPVRKFKSHTLSGGWYWLPLQLISPQTQKTLEETLLHPAANQIKDSFQRFSLRRLRITQMRLLRRPCNTRNRQSWSCCYLNHPLRQVIRVVGRSRRPPLVCTTFHRVGIYPEYPRYETVAILSHFHRISCSCNCNTPHIK
jgi:hypothetical protein